MANYIIALRRTEAQQDEDEYWASVKFGHRRRRRYEQKLAKQADIASGPQVTCVFTILSKIQRFLANEESG